MDWGCENAPPETKDVTANSKPRLSIQNLYDFVKALLCEVGASEIQDEKLMRM